MKKFIFVLGTVIYFILPVSAQTDTLNRDTVKLYFKDKTVTIIVNKRQKEIQEQIDNLDKGLADFEQRLQKQQEILEELTKRLAYYDSLNSRINISQMTDTSNLDDYKFFGDTAFAKIIDSLREQIEKSNKIIIALQSGIDDINASKEELERELEALEGDSVEVVEVPLFKSKKFRPHWAMFEFGVSSFTPDFSKPKPEEYLYQDYEKSVSFGLGFSKTKIKFWRSGGIVLGLGLKWRSYDLYDNIKFFDGDTLNFDEVENMAKNKIKTFSITLPTLFEVQFSKRKRFPYVQTGIIAEAPLKKYYKTVFYENGHKVKQKTDIKQIVNPFFAVGTARLGLKGFNIYVNYDILPFFKKPISEYHPIEVGIGLTF